MQAEEEIIREVQTIKTDAELLASKQGEDSYLRIADQSGKLIELPPEEKKSLAIALALHEKGRYIQLEILKYVLLTAKQIT